MHCVGVVRRLEQERKKLVEEIHAALHPTT